MITSLTTRYRVVFTLSLVLCVLLVFGVPLVSLAMTVAGESGWAFLDSDGKSSYSPKTAWDDNKSASRRERADDRESRRELADYRESRRERADDREPPTREPRRTESCSVEWGHWYVDVITHVIPKLQINTLTNVTTGIPVMGKLSVTTKYTERRDGEEICRVYLGGVYSHSYSRGTRTETRSGERTDYNSIKVIDHTGDLTVLRINETSGDLVLQWSNRYDAYRVHVDVVLFEGSLKQNLPVQVYIWPNGQTTSAINVQTYRSVRVD